MLYPVDIVAKGEPVEMFKMLELDDRRGCAGRIGHEYHYCPKSMFSLLNHSALHEMPLGARPRVVCATSLHDLFVVADVRITWCLSTALERELE